jgi:hypothetical protein
MGLSSLCSRLLFGITLLIVAIKGFYSIDSNKGFASQNIRLMSETLQQKNINFNIIQFRKFSALIVLIENYLLVIASISTILKIGFGKFFAFIAIIIDLVLIHNPIYYDEPIVRLMACEFLALFGAIWNCY